jgi:hypothetical protein
MTIVDPRLTLLLRHIQTRDGGVLMRGARCVSDELLRAGVWTLPLRLRPMAKERSWTTLASIDDLPPDLAHAAADGLVLTDHVRQHCEVELHARDEHMSMHCAMQLQADAPHDALDLLVDIGNALWPRLDNAGPIGPTFAVRPLAVGSPRPLPPRSSTLWSLGDAAYFIDHAFHETSPIGDPQGAWQLRGATLPDGVRRQTLQGLTVVRCAGPSGDKAAFANQLFELEHWMSSVLNLPLHPAFNEYGDIRVVLLGKVAAEPFTFYDPMVATAYKAVTTVDAEPMSPDVRAELAEALREKVLRNGRKVRSVMVIFPTRDAAVRNHQAVAQLGASGSVYVGADHRLWNPEPPGNWKRVGAPST